MEEYLSVDNKKLVVNACKNMIKDKYSNIIADEQVDLLLSDIYKQVVADYENKKLTKNELNNITLGLMKQLCEKYTIETLQPYEVVRDEIIDEYETINKLKKLEFNRNIIPSFAANNSEQEFLSKSEPDDFVAKSNPINISIPTVQKPTYKTFIINSANRDWIKNPERSIINFNTSADINKNKFFPQCICFPHYVKHITPYVIMNITDGIVNQYFSFTVYNTTGGKWDTWVPVDHTECIDLTSDKWSVRFFDFNNNLLDIGNDNIGVSTVIVNDGIFQLQILIDEKSYENNFNTKDFVKIKLSSGKQILKQVMDYSFDDDVATMTIYDKDLTVQDFIESKILNINNQFSLIIKYHIL